LPWNLLVSDTPSLPRWVTLLLPPPQVWQPWLFSRLLIWVTVGLIAPNLNPAHTASSVDWNIFLTADGHWYQQIVQQGYQAGQSPHLTFFPLFPLLCSGLMLLSGMPFIFAGLLINNLAFLAALTILYRWLRDRWHPELAKWTIAAMAWLPLSVFCGVADADGLFLLLNVVTLYYFSAQSYAMAAIGGFCASATRSLGLSLMPTLIAAAWHDRQSSRAYWAGGIAVGGFTLYSLYCTLRFGDPFAFDQALQFWPERPPGLLDLSAWGKTLRSGIVGPIDRTSGKIESIGFPIQFCTIEVMAFLLWRFSDRVLPKVRIAITILLVLWFWSLWPEGLIRTGSVIGGLYLVWSERRSLGPMLRQYAFWSLLWLAFSANPISPERGMFAIAPFTIALGMWLTQNAPWRIPVLTALALMLAGTAVRLHW
jgi:hypothetical protein